MRLGIAIVGLNGSGKSTLAHALAQTLNMYEMDVEDYYFPNQRDARLSALDNLPSEDCNFCEELPYSSPKSKSEVEEAILKDITSHERFILSCVSLNWKDNSILSAIDALIVLHAPMEVRLQRIKEREEKRFGDRTLPGGDMYEQQVEFRKIVASKDEQSVISSTNRVNCPHLTIDEPWKYRTK